MGEQPTLHRRSIRLQGHDYGLPDRYFISLRACEPNITFGHVQDTAVVLTPLGEIVAQEWRRSADLRHEVELDAFVIMPNHFHGIVIIHPLFNVSPVGASGARPSVLPGNAPIAAVTPHPCKERGDRRSPLQRPRGPGKHSLGALIAGFKAAVTRRVNNLRRTPGAPVWQRNYYEHIIRNEDDLAECRAYILNNPLTWAMDRENPLAKRPDATP